MSLIDSYYSFVAGNQIEALDLPASSRVYQKFKTIVAASAIVAILAAALTIIAIAILSKLLIFIAAPIAALALAVAVVHYCGLKRARDQFEAHSSPYIETYTNAIEKINRSYQKNNPVDSYSTIDSNFDELVASINEIDLLGEVKISLIKSCNNDRELIRLRSIKDARRLDDSESWLS